MKITTLLENTKIDPNLVCDHGLSFYVEVEGSQLLFDTGPDSYFNSNAQKLGVDLTEIDYLLVSHGHSDHGGGVKEFMNLNSKAPVYLKEAALTGHYAKKPSGDLKDIGLKSLSWQRDRLRFVQDTVKLNEHLILFSGFTSKGFIPSQNGFLWKEDKNGKLIPDDFDHEICLLIQSGEKNVIITGCSHSGLGNMIETVVTQTGIAAPDVVIGGFHLSNPDSDAIEANENMDQLLAELSRYPETCFYTGHCTGEAAFGYLRNSLGDRLKPLGTGLTITV